ncbi:MAG: hypothetical protein NHF88_00020 [Candidatus Shikimatogenerans bostrichidophilus]|nr:MAG: hypothetical protein NHF88_00020 [Candidatus Shikimatogenerans bostrichidophilus]
MKKLTKNLKRISIHFNKNNKYKINEAIHILKKYNFTKFNSSINIYIKLKKYKDNILTFKKNLFIPYSNGKNNKILVLIEKEYRNIVIKKLNIKFIGGVKYINNIDNNDIIKFDYIISSEYYMKYLLNIAHILGKKKILPNYDNNTIVDKNNYLDIIKKYKKSRNILIKTDKYGIIHLVIGKINFNKNNLIKNYLYIINNIKKNYINNKPIIIDKVYINTTMSPSLKLLI